MQYEQTEVKAPSKDIGQNVLVNAAKRLSTMRLLWIIIVRHKVAILATGNVLLVLNWAIPMWPNMVISLFQ